MLVVRGICKTYQRRKGPAVAALADVDLTVAAGEFVAVTGPSGSGKSTLLFSIGAMAAPTSGTVVLDGTDIYRLAPAQRAALRRTKVAFVFQTFNLIPYLSCLENVALPTILAGASRRHGRERAEAMLLRLGLGERLEHRPAELSVGERQRVALGRSLVNQPQLLLADEPTGNLDGGATDEVMGILAELHRAGQTIIMVTHDLRLAAQGTRVVSLRDGRVVADTAGTKDAPSPLEAANPPLETAA